MTTATKTCTGDWYEINPGFPDEGRDVRHYELCPVHPEPLEEVIRRVLYLLEDENAITVRNRQAVAERLARAVMGAE